MKINKKYESWLKYLKMFNLEYGDQDFYTKNIDKIDTSCITVLSIQFFKGRYGFFLDENTINHMFETVKKDILEKKGSMYNVETVMKKRGLSKEEAERFVEDYKSKTNGSFENFKKRYGEEAEERFRIFKEKSKSSFENFKLRYGEEEGLNRWNYYLSTRDSSSLESYLKRHGDDGYDKYNQYIESLRKHSTLEGLKELYGEEEGKQRYKELCAKKSVDLDFFIKKYGKEEGELKYIESNKKKSITVDNYISKYGKEEGVKQFELNLIKRSPIFIELKKLYPTEVALEKYNEYKKTNNIDKKIVSNATSKFKKYNGGMYSKKSENLFKKLEESLGRELMYGRHKGELKIFDEESMSKYSYDCYDSLTNTIVEYHGEAFHPMEGDVSWVNPYGTPYEVVLNKDKLKKDLALKLGYNYIVVWEKDVKSASKLLEKVKELELLLKNENN